MSTPSFRRPFFLQPNPQAFPLLECSPPEKWPTPFHAHTTQTAQLGHGGAWSPCGVHQANFHQTVASSHIHHGELPLIDPHRPCTIEDSSSYPRQKPGCHPQHRLCIPVHTHLSPGPHRSVSHGDTGTHSVVSTHIAAWLDSTSLSSMAEKILRLSIGFQIQNPLSFTFRTGAQVPFSNMQI